MDTKALAISGVATFAICSAVAGIFWWAKLDKSPKSTIVDTQPDPIPSIIASPEIPDEDNTTEPTEPLLQPQVDREEERRRVAAEADKIRERERIELIRKQVVQVLAKNEFAATSVNWTGRFLVAGSVAQWKSASDADKLAFGLGLGVVLNPEADEKFQIGAGLVYIRIMEDWFKSLDDPEKSALLPVEVIELIAVMTGEEKFNAAIAETASNYQRNMNEIEARRSGRIVSIDVLRKRDTGSGYAFEMRVKNRSAELIHGVSIQVELSRPDGEYVGIAEATAFQISPQASEIVQATIKNTREPFDYVVSAKVIGSSEPFAFDVTKPTDEEDKAEEKRQRDKAESFRKLERLP